MDDKGKYTLPVYLSYQYTVNTRMSSAESLYKCGALIRLVTSPGSSRIQAW